MHVTVRPWVAEDSDHLIALTLRAWTPVFESLGMQLGDELFSRLRGDWRATQSEAVRDTVSDPSAETWVAEVDGERAGFVSARAQQGSDVGEIAMIAVDPPFQRSGVGAALVDHAVAWLRDQGMGVAMIDTGGDPEHLVARGLYESAGFTALPVTRFFKAL